MDSKKSVQKLDIPTLYDDPKRDAAEVRRKLDDEVRRESDAFRKSISGEYRHGASPTLSTATGTPDRRLTVPRMNSNTSDASEKGKHPARRSVTFEEPFANFADFETSSWPSPQVAKQADNPFVMKEAGSNDELVNSLCQLSDSDVKSIIQELMTRRPSLVPIIHAAINQYL